MATDFALRAALEAILTVAETPLNLVTLAGALEVPIAQVKQEIEGLVNEYESANDGLGRGFELRLIIRAINFGHQRRHHRRAGRHLD